MGLCKWDTYFICTNTYYIYVKIYNKTIVFLALIIIKLRIGKKMGKTCKFFLG
jgi:hypothetical protein